MNTLYVLYSLLLLAGHFLTANGGSPVRARGGGGEGKTQFFWNALLVDTSNLFIRQYLPSLPPSSIR